MIHERTVRDGNIRVEGVSTPESNERKDIEKTIGSDWKDDSQAQKVIPHIQFPSYRLSATSDRRHHASNMISWWAFVSHSVIQPMTWPTSASHIFTFPAPAQE
jgi:hypothetical protein